ncbi:sigma-70 family RNA polymerase sigma factor [Streptomyces sp. ATCC51928]|uniref:Sigma-70 family RNA polymerase sigma factor n=1 Tax=Streptomyces caviscabies TaxID=90079 RepID=A0ABW2MFW7_9ACTN|nr:MULTISPECIES: sigma-70 family RNA polymerase sigma factor [unclassified Streptomyces]MDX3503536.1 sigma-70 family RNA polymerase sigma factor [Streptomyces sp. ATCC51928]MDX5525385.1 sigma-70 family RNA polymerase sigma factor [Streptomyces sp. DE06-01C]
MHNAPDIRGPADPHHLSSTPQGSVPRARELPEPKPRRRLTAQQVDELTRLKPFLENMTRQARMEYLMDDLVQNAALQLIRAWTNPDFVLDRQDGGRAFARKVMRNVIADAARANDRNLSSPMGDIPDEAAVEPDEGEHVRDDRLKSIGTFLRDNLPEKLYPVGHLAIIEGLTQGEIARTLGIDRHTVGRRLKKVGEALEPHRATVHDEVLGDVTS